MSVTDDKSRAVVQAAALLRELKSLECSPSQVERVRAEAARLLRSFPTRRDVNLATRAMNFVMGFGEDE